MENHLTWFIGDGISSIASSIVWNANKNLSRHKNLCVHLYFAADSKFSFFLCVWVRFYRLCWCRTRMHANPFLHMISREPSAHQATELVVGLFALTPKLPSPYVFTHTYTFCVLPTRIHCFCGTMLFEISAWQRCACAPSTIGGRQRKWIGNGFMDYCFFSVFPTLALSIFNLLSRECVRFVYGCCGYSYRHTIPATHHQIFRSTERSTCGMLIWTRRYQCAISANTHQWLHTPYMHGHDTQQWGITSNK